MTASSSIEAQMSLFPDQIMVYVIFKNFDNAFDPIGVFKGTPENLESFMKRNYNDPDKYFTVKVPHYCEKGVECCGCKFYDSATNKKEANEG